MESQSDERDYSGIVEHAVDISATAIGDLRARGDSARGGGERGHRVESRNPCQAGAAAGMRDAGLPADVT